MDISFEQDEPSAQRDADLTRRWAHLQRWTLRRFGREADVEGLLFLIGMQELGLGYDPGLDKRQKEQIVLEGTYCVLALLGYFRRVGMEGSGHWIWEASKPLPDVPKPLEERRLQSAVLRYFDTNYSRWVDEAERGETK